MSTKVPKTDDWLDLLAQVESNAQWTQFYMETCVPDLLHDAKDLAEKAGRQEILTKIFPTSAEIPGRFGEVGGLAGKMMRHAERVNLRVGQMARNSGSIRERLVDLMGAQMLKDGAQGLGEVIQSHAVGVAPAGDTCQGSLGLNDRLKGIAKQLREIIDELGAESAHVAKPASQDGLEQEGKEATR